MFICTLYKLYTSTKRLLGMEKKCLPRITANDSIGWYNEFDTIEINDRSYNFVSINKLRIQNFCRKEFTDFEANLKSIVLIREAALHEERIRWIDRLQQMYTCINCGVEVEELYRRYSPSVLKVLKCNKCGSLADKYIEYDPVIVLVDLVLLEKPAYRHLLYNSGFQSYWKLMVVLLLSESFRVWSTYGPQSGNESVTRLDKLKTDIFDGERSFYILLAHTGVSLCAFVCAVIVGTELRWFFIGRRPHKYKASDLVRALTVGGCAKLLGLLGLVWQHVAHDPHYALIHGYTMLCLLTAYSVVCESGRGGSLIGLAGGLLAHDYVSNSISWMPQAPSNVTLIQNGT